MAMFHSNYVSSRQVEPTGIMSCNVSTLSRVLLEPEAAIAGTDKKLSGNNTIVEDKVDRISERRSEQNVVNTTDEEASNREAIIDLTEEVSVDFRQFNSHGASQVGKRQVVSQTADVAQTTDSEVDSERIMYKEAEEVKEPFQDMTEVATPTETKIRKGNKNGSEVNKEQLDRVLNDKVKQVQTTGKNRQSSTTNKKTSSHRVKSLVEKSTTSVLPPKSRQDLISSAAEFNRCEDAPPEYTMDLQTAPGWNVDLSKDLTQINDRVANASVTSKGVDEEYENISQYSGTDEVEVTSELLVETRDGPEDLNPGVSTGLSCNPCAAQLPENRETTSAKEEFMSDDFASACTWYLCSSGDKGSSKEEGGDSNVEKPTNEELPGLWSSVKYWIDPAPTALMEDLNAVDEDVFFENVAEGVEPNAIDENGNSPVEPNPVESSSPRSEVDHPVVEDNEQSLLVQNSKSTVGLEMEREVDQDSGVISDAELNSIPALAPAVETHKGLLPANVSAFEPVKPLRLSPAASLELAPSDQNEAFEVCDDGDDLSVEGSTSNLLGDDLKSIPSVKEDVTVGVSDLQPEDLGSAPTQPDCSSIAESLAKLKMRESGKAAANKDKPKNDESFEAKRQSLVKELRAAISTFGRYDIRCAHLSSSLGDLLDECGDHSHAIRLHKDATIIYSCKLGEDHATTMNAKIRLARVLENAQHYDEAINLYYLVTVMRRALEGENHPSVADGLVHMAQALRKKADFVQAIKELKRALKIYRESLGDAHERVSNTVDQIASLYVTIGDFDKSAAILEEVVKLKAATMGMSSKAVAQTLTTLATTYECSEKFYNAMKALKKAYKIYTELGGYSSEDSTAVLNRIAQLYEATGDQHRASIAYLGVLRARKILRGADSLSVGETYFRLGHSLRETGQFDKALKCLKEALPIFVGQGVEMNDMKMVADIMHEMAFINQDKGNYQDAVRIFKQELSVRRKIGQPEFPLVARTLNHLGVAEFELQNNNKALKFLVEALSIFQERGEQGIECAEVLFNTGLVFEAVHNTKRALEAYTEAVRIFREHGYSDDHPHLRKAVEKAAKVRKEV